MCYRRLGNQGCANIEWLLMGNHSSTMFMPATAVMRCMLEAVRCSDMHASLWRFRGTVVTTSSVKETAVLGQAPVHGAGCTQGQSVGIEEGPQPEADPATALSIVPQCKLRSQRLHQFRTSAIHHLSRSVTRPPSMLLVQQLATACIPESKESTI